MIDQVLGKKIVDEINKFSNKKYAVVSSYGEVLAKSNDFGLEHQVLDIKSKRALPLKFEAKKVGYLYLDENPTIVKETGNVVRSMAELIIHENYYKDVLTSDEKRFDQLIYDFLNLEGIDSGELRRVVASFGVNLNKNRLAIFIEIENENYLFLDEKEAIEGDRDRKIGRIKREINTALTSFYTHHKENVISYLGGNHFVIFKDMGDKPVEYQEEFKKTLNTLFYNLQNELRTKLTVGVGEYKPGLYGLRESFEEARTALKFGKQIWGLGQIYHYDSFGVVAPLFSGVTEENITFSKNIVKSLEKHPDLMESLKIYFEYDLSLSKTARKLKIHRNTLVYRLERINEITGFDPRVFNEAFQLQLALILERYSK
jgi:carbohydrate diacid regulator